MIMMGSFIFVLMGILSFAGGGELKKLKSASLTLSSRGILPSWNWLLPINCSNFMIRMCRAKICACYFAANYINNKNEMKCLSL